MKLFTLTLFGFLMCYGVLNSQVYKTDVSDFTPAEIIQDLSQGVMLVRLNMKKRTLQAYENRIEDATDEEYRATLEKKLRELENERWHYKKVVTQAFSEHFDFTDVYFIENQHFDEFLDGDLTNVFDSEGRYSTFPPDVNYYVLVQGDNDLHWIIRDNSLNPLAPGLSDEYDIGFKRVVNLLAGKDNSNLEDMSKTAKRISERLTKFYRK